MSTYIKMEIFQTDRYVISLFSLKPTRFPPFACHQMFRKTKNKSK